jgi:hypothetical protein
VVWGVSCVQTVWLLRLDCGFSTASDFDGGVWNVGEGQAVWLGHYVCDVSVWCASEEGVRMKVGMYRVGNVCSLRNDGYLVLLQDIIED